MRQLRLAMAQLNMVVGDFAGNTGKVLETIKRARSSGVDLVTFPELAVCGYPPEDLLLKPQFIEQNLQSLRQIISETAGITAIVGFVDAREDIYNAAAIIHDGKMVDVYHKTYLPNYGVFDENRYFQAGKRCPVYTINGVGVGVNICEDIWYEVGPAIVQAYAGAEVIINISSSPYYFGRSKDRERMLRTRASDNVAIFAYTNLVGGQDELVFDGASMVVDERGRLLARGRQFAEDFIVVDLDVESVFRTRLHDPRWRNGESFLNQEKCGEPRIFVSAAVTAGNQPPLPQREFSELSPDEEVYSALVTGTHDYIRKNGFEKVVIGLSGGVDSSLTAAIAVDALGSANVIGLSMPSRYSSTSTITDAGVMAKNLGIRLITIPIEKIFQAYLDTLAEPFTGTRPDITEENLQSRIRGNTLMALSNKFGWIVLNTGNKSEMATGYTTLYGDMAGGFSVLKDVLKTLVYKLSAYRNARAGFDLIPASIITRPPSAELRPDQKDSDSLPVYDLLDPILTAYVEEDKSIEQIIAMGFDPAVVRRTARLVDSSEYKRRQSPPGIKITPRAFGRDRRLPITSQFRGNAIISPKSIQML